MNPIKKIIPRRPPSFREPHKRRAVSSDKTALITTRIPAPADNDIDNNIRVRTTIFFFSSTPSYIYSGVCLTPCNKK